MTCAAIERDTLIPVSEAARILSLDPKTIYKWIDARLIAFSRVGPTRSDFRVRLSDLCEEVRPESF